MDGDGRIFKDATIRRIIVTEALIEIEVVKLPFCVVLDLVRQRSRLLVYLGVCVCQPSGLNARR